MSLWTYRDKTELGQQQPHYFGALGNNILAIVGHDPAPGGGHMWYVADCLPGGLQKRIASDVAASIEAGKRAAEAAASTYTRKPGRRPVNERPMTSAERNRRQISRLMATESAAEVETQLLARLHEDLVVAGVTDWASRVAQILRIVALKAVAEYTRRNSVFFVRNAPAMLDHRAIERRCQRIETLAGKVEETTKSEQFETILAELHKEGFFPEKSLVSAVYQAFLLGAKAPD